MVEDVSIFASAVASVSPRFDSVLLLSFVADDGGVL